MSNSRQRTSSPAFAGEGDRPGKAGMVERFFFRNQEAPPPPSAAPLPGKSRGGRETGFTLIEMLVALAIFSLAALALLRLQGGTLKSTARLQSGIVAGIVARNVAVEAITDKIAPAFGRSSGQETNAGRIWRWTRVVGRTGEARLQQITVTVADETGQQAATLTAFRSAG